MQSLEEIRSRIDKIDKEIVELFLNENSPAYRKRRSREATKNSYHKSIMTYFVLLIHGSNK